MSTAEPIVPTEPTAKVVKPPGFIRWWGFIALFVFILLVAVIAPLVIQAWVKRKIVNGLASQGWKLADPDALSVSVFSARVGGEALKVQLITTGEDVVSMDRLNAQLALGDSWHLNDIVIQELAIEGLSGSLRRGPDGRVKAVEPDEPAKPDAKPGTPIDWQKLYQQGMDQYQKYSEKKKAEQEAAKNKPSETTKKPERPAPEFDVDWPKAQRYQPIPTEGRHIPRVVVRRLAVSGKGLPLPDESVFDITSFALEGTNVALRQDVGERMTLNAKVQTKGAGEISLAVVRKEDDTGSLSFQAPAVPLSALDSPAIGGGLANSGLAGTAAVVSDNTWTGWLLDGDLTAKLTGLTLTPNANTDDHLRQAAPIINALKGRTISWPVKLGGTLVKPTITDSGLQRVIADNQDALKDALKEAAKAKLEEEKQKALKKGEEKLNDAVKDQIQKNPEAQKAVDAGKDALKGLFGR